jgi:ABC-type glycerol-3-phosphate transport system substrate-binding protein
MQLFYLFLTRLFARANILSAAALIPLLVAAGCMERPTTIDPTPARPHAGVVLRIAASDPNDRELLRQLAASWAVRSGAEVRVLDTEWDGSADVGLIRTPELGRWAEPGLVMDLPAAFKSTSHPYRWDDTLPIYSVRLTSWSERTYCLPVLGEGMVLVYRKDAFDGKGNHPSAPPGTWDDLLESGRKLGSGSLVPLPADPERLSAEFFSAAASYDRLATGRVETADLTRDRDAFFAFQFNPATGEPRLNAPAFQHVAERFRQMEQLKLRSTAANAVTAFLNGEAKIGIVSLNELGSIAAKLGEQIGVAPIPGAGFVFDATGGRKAQDQQTVNRLPYLGWGGRVGVVSKKCASPGAAWDFLADAGTPERTALDLIAAPRWGAGPYRISQLDARARSRWFAYGLPPQETDHLTTTLRENLGQGVQNYRIRLRTPNQHELSVSLDRDLRTIIKSKEPANLEEANRHWKEINDRQPAGEWKAQARKSLGI